MAEHHFGSNAPAYDFIIVGAGSAGCTLANRLTEEPGVTVLLLEAGPRDKTWAIHMPAGMGQVIGGTRHDWRYHSGPEPYCGDRMIFQPRGLGLGGSSSINGMMYVRGHARDYDRWAEQLDCPGWSYSEILPYFRRSECWWGGENPYHGDKGLLRASHGDAETPLHKAFLDAGQQAGYPLTDDFNGYQNEGFGRYDRSIWQGERWSTAKGSLAAAIARGQVTVETGALALEVLFQNRRAVGLAYAKGSSVIEARAEREVILAAGAMNSPHLLMHSGVGPADHLARHGIEVRQDLPGVGQNLRDHPDVVMQWECTRPVSIYPWTKPPRKWMVGIEWFLRKSGHAASNHFDVGAFIRSDAGIEHPDLQLTFMSVAVIPGTTKVYPGHAFQIHVDLLRPTSVGELTLASSDPREKPRVVFNYLKTEEDRKALRAAGRLMREIVSQPSFADLCGKELTPGSDAVSDADLDRWAREVTETGYHPVGSCKMGPQSDPMAVVDPELNVHGLENLRVVDASIMPDLVSGNTNAPTVMIGEKASDMIRGRSPLAPSNAPVWLHPDWKTAQR